MKLDKEILAATNRIKLHIEKWEHALNTPDDMSLTRVARIEGMITGLTDALKIVENM